MKFIITSHHDIYKTVFEQGDTDHVNTYTLDFSVEAINVGEAIKKYFVKLLGYYFSEAYADFTKDNLFLHYRTLVDVSNDEVEEGSEKIERWKKGEVELYANMITLSVKKVEDVKIKFD